MTMMTLCIRYRFNPDRIADVREYFETEQRVIERSGGKIVGYFLPTEFAGPTDEAMGLIDIPSMGAYEDYRKRRSSYRRKMPRMRTTCCAMAGVGFLSYGCPPPRRALR